MLTWLLEQCRRQVAYREAPRAFGVGRRLEIGAARPKPPQVTLNVPVTKGWTVQ